MAKQRPPGQRLSDTNPEAGPPVSMKAPDNSLISGPTLARPKGRTIIGNLPVIVEGRAGAVGAPPSPAPEEAETDGKPKERYIVGEILGEGGMGVVYKGTKLSYLRGKPVPKEVAIKVLKFNEEELRALGIQDLEAVERQMTERFITECQVINLLNHPNIIEIMDVGEKDFGSGQVEPFYVMPFHKGKELEDMVVRGGPLPWEQARILMVQTTRALEAAHNNIDTGTGERNPIVHRDVKPANIFVLTDSDGTQTVKVLDFGIAKIVAPTADDPTHAGGAVMGTPHYMAPEQACGMTIDNRTDIYGLGATMYHVLTGCTVFDADKVVELLQKVRDDKVVPLREKRPELDIPEEAERIVMKCLEKDPAKRYQTMGELREDILRSGGMGTIDIARLQSGEGWNAISARFQRMNTPEGASNHTMKEGEMVTALRRKRKRMIGLAAGLGAVIAAGVITTGLLFSRRDRAETPARSAAAQISRDAKAPMAEPIRRDAKAVKVTALKKEKKRTVTFMTTLEGVEVFSGDKLICVTAKDGTCKITLGKGEAMKATFKLKGYKDKTIDIYKDTSGSFRVTLEKKPAWRPMRRRRKDPMRVKPIWK